jgi:hypothetical protein
MSFGPGLPSSLSSRARAWITNLNITGSKKAPSYQLNSGLVKYQNQKADGRE